MSVGAPLDELAATLGALAPARHIDRAFLDFGERDLAQLEVGTYTVIGRGARTDEAGRLQLELMLVGQIVLAEATSPAAVEAAEWAMVGELLALSRRVDGLELGTVQTSGQIEHPYGWVSARATLGPYLIEDLTGAAEAGPWEQYHASHPIEADTPTAGEQIDLEP